MINLLHVSSISIPCRKYLSHTETNTAILIQELAWNWLKWSSSMRPQNNSNMKQFLLTTGLVIYENFLLTIFYKWTECLEIVFFPFLDIRKKKKCKSIVYQWITKVIGNSYKHDILVSCNLFFIFIFFNLPRKCHRCKEL